MPLQPTDTYKWTGYCEDYTIGTRISSFHSDMQGTVTEASKNKFRVVWDYYPDGPGRVYDRYDCDFPFIINKPQNWREQGSLTFTASPSEKARTSLQTALVGAVRSGSAVIDIDHLIVALDAAGWVIPT
jgi:hypothetical protein